MTIREVYPPYDQVPVKFTDIAVALLKAVGLPCDTEHTAMTPFRLCHYLLHLTGVGEDIHLTTFKNEDPIVSHMVAVPHIPFWSACSHHLLPFMGKISVGYVPNKELIGLSKIPLLVRQLAQGFWMQEHLANEIADQLEELLEPLGLGVFVEATHTCQLLDLKQPPIPVMRTSVLRGILLHGPAARDEFYRLIR